VGKSSLQARTSQSVDLVLRGGHVVDPSTATDEVVDIGIVAGKIAHIGALSTSGATTLDLTGCDVLPGVVDLHVHASSDFSGRAAHAMLARAGVTTALDLAGPVADVLQLSARHGVGLTIGCLEALVPGSTIPSADATRGDIERAIDAATRGGACGVKILGGHFPLTPDATNEAIDAANERGVWLAVHCGTTSTGSNLEGLEELLRLAAGRPVHVAHVNSYCRGSHAPALAEAQRAVELVEASEGVFSESYVARINGTWGTCVDGLPISDRTRAALRAAAFAETESGLEEALLQGYAQVHAMTEDDVQLEAGPHGIELWRQAATRIGVSFPVNDVRAAIAIATARTPTGSFAVDAWASDGGGIPRNNALAAGYHLVGLGLLSLSELVAKVSATPARAFGLTAKGHLAQGADADVVAMDPRTGLIRATVARGRVIMLDGRVIPHPTAWLCLPEGRKEALVAGLEPVGLDRPLQPTRPQKGCDHPFRLTETGDSSL
jgi:dihydroorotase-like cyclic amidohydrolase